MSAHRFPDPATYDFPQGIVVGRYLVNAPGVIAIGVPPTTENLINAYRKGIFPWPSDWLPLPWHCPDPRAVLIFDELHIPRSLAKEQKKCRYKFTIDRCFQQVVEQCSLAPRPGQSGTWITSEIIEAYTALHRAGMAHSVEAWSENGALMGGLYGVDAGGVFCGESMFHIAPNASKLALLFLIEYLKSRGSAWLDVQVMTPHMKALGTRNIPRRQFLRKLKKTQSLELDLFGISPAVS